MTFRVALPVFLFGTALLLSSCATKQEPVAQNQTPAFGEPASTIPWNQPQKWEGGGAGFSALRNGEDN